MGKTKSFCLPRPSWILARTEKSCPKSKQGGPWQGSSSTSTSFPNRRAARRRLRHPSRVADDLGGSVWSPIGLSPHLKCHCVISLGLERGLCVFKVSFPTP